MQRLALDTTAYTALGRGNQQLAGLVAKSLQIGIPITVLGEIYFGAFNGSRQTANLQTLDKFLGNARVETLYSDELTAKLFGQIATELRRQGTPIQQNDIWIAALCKQYDYALATSDSGFDNILGLEVVKFDIA